MTRRDFAARVKVAAFERAKGHCEGCGAHLTVGKFHYDHDLADGLGGEPTLENCRVLCQPCHGTKTRTGDVPAIAKLKRVRAAHLGAKRSKSPFKGWRRFNGEAVRNPKLGGGRHD